MAIYSSTHLQSQQEGVREGWISRSGQPSVDTCLGLMSPRVQRNLPDAYSLMFALLTYIVLRSIVPTSMPGTFMSMALFISQVPFCSNGNVRGAFQINCLHSLCVSP